MSGCAAADGEAIDDAEQPAQQSEAAVVPEAESEAIPRSINIDIVGAVIGPMKSDSNPWDGFGSVPAGVGEALGVALGAPAPYVAVASFLQTAAANSLSKPDPFGTATLNDSNAITLANADNNTENTFTPNWPGRPGWRNVAYSTDLRIRVTLQDEDIWYHDDIGVIEINSRDIAAAWASQHVYPVNVADQSSRQLLFVMLSVTPGS